MKIKFNNNFPIYFQIVLYFKIQIINGALLPGEVLPSRREFAALLGVNINTVQRAFSQLEREKIIITYPNRNSCIQDDSLIIQKIRRDLISEYLNSFLENIKDLNVSFSELVNIIEEKYK